MVKWVSTYSHLLQTFEGLTVSGKLGLFLCLQVTELKLRCGCYWETLLHERENCQRASATQRWNGRLGRVWEPWPQTIQGETGSLGPTPPPEPTAAEKPGPGPRPQPKTPPPVGTGVAAPTLSAPSTLGALAEMVGGGRRAGVVAPLGKTKCATWVPQVQEEFCS